MKVLVIDVGGTNLKVSVGGEGEIIKIPSGPTLTAAAFASKVKEAVAGRVFDAVSIGYPGPVVNGRPAVEPKNLSTGWVDFDFETAFGKPVRVVNDAAMQALGGYTGGRMLFLGLGTGLGSALIVDGVLAPMELAHMPYRKEKTFEDYVGLRGYEKLGKKKWQDHVHKVVAILKHGLQADNVLLGGGQAKKLKELPDGTRMGNNADAITGGLRLWNDSKQDRQGQPFVVGNALRGKPTGETKGGGAPPAA
jgi:polyphosphate glucokinase